MQRGLQGAAFSWQRLLPNMRLKLAALLSKEASCCLSFEMSVAA